MGSGCGNGCMKCCLFIFNIFFLVVGLAVMSGGIYLLVRSNEYTDIFETPHVAAAVITATGIAISTVAFLGCCGALRDGKCMLYTYALVIGIAIIIEIAGATLSIMYMENVSEFARRGFRQAIGNYKPDQPTYPTTALVDNIQSSLKCCGADRQSDWTSLNPGLANYYTGKLPISCCYQPLDHDNRDCTPQFASNRSCGEALDETIKVLLGVLCGLVLLVALAQLIAACFACNVAKDSSFSSSSP